MKRKRANRPDFVRALSNRRVNLGRSYRCVRTDTERVRLDTTTDTDGQRIVLGAWVRVSMELYVSGEEARMFGGDDHV